MLSLYCRRPLAVWRELLNWRFCSREHQRKYQSAQHQYALKALRESELNGPRAAVEPDSLTGLARGEDEELALVAAGAGEEADVESGRAPSPSTGQDEAARNADSSGDDTGAARSSEHGAAESQGMLPQDLERSLAMLEYDRHFYQEILDKAPVGIAMLSRDMTPRYTNQCFRDLSSSDGADALTETGFRNSVAMLMKGLSEGGSDRAEQLLESPDGTTESLQRIFAVRLPIRDDEDPDYLLVVESPTTKPTDAG